VLEVNCQVNYFLNYCMIWLGQARFWVKSKSKPRLRGRGSVKGLDSRLYLTKLRVRFRPLPMPTVHTEMWTRHYKLHMAHRWRHITTDCKYCTSLLTAHFSTLHCLLNTVYSALHTVHCLQCTAYRTLRTVHCLE
jgi:hypothetical protein